jgi:hypothetical protein
MTLQDNRAKNEMGWSRISSQPEILSYSTNRPSFFDLRMLAIRLIDGSFMVYSPIPSVDEKIWRALDQMGPVSAILAPNHYHNLGLQPCLRRYGKLRLIAAADAIPRLSKKTALVFETTEALSQLLPKDLKWATPESLKAGEVWLYTQTVDGSGSDRKQLLIVCDAFFNMRHAKSGLIHIIFRLAGTYPGLRVSRLFPLIGAKDLDQYKAWLQAFFARVRPNVLIPAHGDIVEGADLADKLLALL